MKNQTKPHFYVIFDGTSVYVGSEADITEDIDILFSSDNFLECCDNCDEQNGTL